MDETGAFIPDTTAYTGRRAHAYWWQRQFGRAATHARVTATGYATGKATVYAKEQARYGAGLAYNYTSDWFSKANQNATGESRASLRFFRR